VAPSAVQACDAVTELDGLVALVTLAGAVALHPVMVHHLQKYITFIFFYCSD